MLCIRVRFPLPKFRISIVLKTKHACNTINYCTKDIGYFRHQVILFIHSWIRRISFGTQQYKTSEAVLEEQGYPHKLDFSQDQSICFFNFVFSFLFWSIGFVFLGLGKRDFKPPLESWSQDYLSMTLGCYQGGLESAKLASYSSSWFITIHHHKQLPIFSSFYIILFYFLMVKPKNHSEILQTEKKEEE